MDARKRIDHSVGRAGVTVERTSERELVVTRTVAPGAHRVRSMDQAGAVPAMVGAQIVRRSLISYEADVRTGGTYRLVMGHPSSEQPWRSSVDTSK